MDVQCERCKAEYEFDDALVSARGTTVKCTSCGHQFKIRRPESVEPGGDRWIVRTIEGRELVFLSLREMQKAILARQVGRADTLVRGGGPPRALGAIAELEPFFDEARDASGPRPAPSGSHSTRPPMGTAPGGLSPPRPVPARTASGHPVTAPPPPATPTPNKRSSRPPAPLGGRPAPALRPLLTPAPPPAGAGEAGHGSGHPSFASSDSMRPRVDTIRPPPSAPAVPPVPAALPRPAAVPEMDGGHAARPAVSVAPVLSAGDMVPESVEPDSERLNTPPQPMHAHAPPPPPPVRSVPPPAPRTSDRAGASGPPPGARTLISSPPQARTASTAPARMNERSERPPPPSIQPVYEPPPPRRASLSAPATSSMPAPTMPVRVDHDDPFRNSMPSMDESEMRIPGRPRRVGGWVVAVVLLLGAGVLGLAVAKPYLAAKSAAQAGPPLDPKAQQLLAEGERAMTTGDLEAANDDFNKASALAEKDPRVLVDLARLASARADVPWLKLKLLGKDASDDERGAKAQLDELAARARERADAAVSAAPDQAGSTLAKIDALRISGDTTGARSLVSKVIANASQPDTAYALAALDLAEPEPLWPMVIERLRLAATGEGNAGRARASLVYALARSGDAAGAKAELEKLVGLARPYPLAGALRAFVARVPEAAGVDAGSTKGGAGKVAGLSTTTATVDVNALPHPAAAGGGGGGGFRGATDPRVMMQQAEAAKATRDLDRARTLYTSVLAQNPSDSEALAGLGDVAHAQHDLPGAAGYYRRALAVNPVYLPALVGLGDVEWESGDPDEARKTYRDISERFPEGTYPARVRQRANESGAAKPPPATPSPDPAPTATSAPTSDPAGASQ